MIRNKSTKSIEKHLEGKIYISIGLLKHLQYSFFIIEAHFFNLS